MAQARTGDHVRVRLTGRLDDGTVFATADENLVFDLELVDVT